MGHIKVRGGLARPTIYPLEAIQESITGGIWDKGDSYLLAVCQLVVLFKLCNVIVSLLDEGTAGGLQL